MNAALLMCFCILLSEKTKFNSQYISFQCCAFSKLRVECISMYVNTYLPNKYKSLFLLKIK